MQHTEQTPGSERYGLHSRAHCAQTKIAVPQGDNGGKQSQPDETEVESNDESFEHAEDAAPGGAEANTTTERELRRQAANIEELDYREVYL